MPLIEVRKVRSGSVFAEAGRKGAAKRWGPPRRVNLGDLSPERRRLILALIEQARVAEQAEAPGDGQR